MILDVARGGNRSCTMGHRSAMVARPALVLEILWLSRAAHSPRVPGDAGALRPRTAAQGEANLQPLWQYFTFTENPHPTAFTHVWALCVEEHFYLLFPLIFWALLRRPSLRTVVGVCLAVLAFGIAWRAYPWFTFVEHAGEEAWRP